MDAKGKTLSKANQVKNCFIHHNLPGEDAIERTPEQELNLAALQSGRRLQKGTKTVLAVRIIINDGAYSHATRTGLSNDIFGNGVDAVNLYAACSYNQLVFNKAADRNVSTTWRHRHK
jgi:hypothetical protein